MSRTIPLLRVFDYDQAVAFYIDWLGFTLVREDKPEAGRFYLEISKEDIVLGLIQHPDDGSMGAWVLIREFTGLVPYRDTFPLGSPFQRPALRQVPQEPRTLSMTVIDPFYNRIEFREKIGGS
jgi:catechol 2,3-dioxygenase-like lactoylglutathione lyase family enzyme